ncbi:DeoR/GlpR family DNA-binding transcription regulator [Pseudonocardia phyllosphaerae]|uniref:DeoR/GlpR family DNA-binding transcription regulator n=1 Tax=Pseudonocardia phyllosphaerae TaxID=3390502 RepID=UPI00397C5725
MSLLGEQRRELIVEQVRERGAVRVSELAEHLSVSEMTVRRDLDVLARRRLVDKVHGGATAVGELGSERLGEPAGHGTDEPEFAAKADRERREKEAIAAEAARLVEPGAAIGLSAGSTTWRLASLLARVPRLTVVTNSLVVADALYSGGAEARGSTVILTGGVRTPSEALVGPVAVGSLRSVNLEIVFLGVHGMSAAAGYSTPNLTERDTDRALVDAGQSLVVVADHTKWGGVGISTIAELGEADVLVTDDGLPEDGRAVLESEVGRVILARPGT